MVLLRTENLTMGSSLQIHLPFITPVSVPTTVRNIGTGQMTSTPAETADYLLAQYFPDDNPLTAIGS
jgi:hypothetical protein